MKTYAIEIFFNKEFDLYVRELWKLCHEKNLSSFMNSVQGTEPHIALALYGDIEQLNLVEKFREFTQYDLNEFELHFDAVAIFPQSMVTYLQPNSTREFTGLMTKIHKFFQEFEEYCNPYYAPGRWFPHTSIGKNNSLEEGLKTINYIIGRFKPQIARATRLVLVEIDKGENNISCRNLLTKELKKTT
ncbi:2'-5' RNA ligase family protein [Paenibacillus dakarensis]|uniref:2'-5' RNA ligase family protein n=1 Tax=Paenibacillus dakarensis TaxID=1527293 RepID=UPI0006D55884|nr:2'-5' RNA ligase family protein [Paenibacillus dakarensis]